ncbi:MAG TPA: aerial mycelium formation protein [Mycobacteriales bacterium]|nr:aerial mycelium formation protein [Mycobacteriales bacterium]
MSTEGEMVEGTRRGDRVLAPDYLEGLRDADLARVRELRADAEQEEVDLSYLRRVLHGRIDIVRAELARRDSPSGESLVANLAGILADDLRGPAHGSGRHAAVEPSRVASRQRTLETLLGDVDLSDLAVRNTDELHHALTTLVDYEAELSTERRQVQSVMDACSAEITRRYRDGEASVDALLSQPEPS